MKPKPGVGGIKQIGLVAHGDNFVADARGRQPAPEVAGLEGADGKQLIDMEASRKRLGRGGRSTRLRAFAGPFAGRT